MSPGHLQPSMIGVFPAVNVGRLLGVEPLFKRCSLSARQNADPGTYIYGSCDCRF